MPQAGQAGQAAMHAQLAHDVCSRRAWTVIHNSCMRGALLSAQECPSRTCGHGVCLLGHRHEHALVKESATGYVVEREAVLLRVGRAAFVHGAGLENESHPWVQLVVKCGDRYAFDAQRQARDGR